MTIFMNSFILLLLFQILTARGAIVSPNKEPCDYRDTVRLDPSTKQTNGSYLYKNKTIIPANKIHTYDYEILIGKNKTSVKEHLRGCICEIKKCISICCPDEEEYVGGTCNTPQFLPDPFINVTNEKNQIEQVDINEQFELQLYRPCEGLFHLNSKKNSYHNFTINKDGLLYLIEEKLTYDKNEYCLSPVVTDQFEFLYTPLQCYLPNPVNAEEVKRFAIALLISVPFMILTIIVYLLLPSLRTIHGFSLCCYLGGLIIGYSSLAYLNLESKVSTLLCSVLGYAAYFGFLSAFFWLSVISFDLFFNIYGKGTNQKMKQFRLYGLYSWGLALIFVICAYVAQNSDLPDAWKSGIGSSDFCFLNGLQPYGATLYFYGPMLIIVVLNTIMFALTFNQIRQNMKAGFNANKTQMDHRALCWTFLRLFIVMGITWMAELIEFYITKNYDNAGVNFFTKCSNIINGLQGLIIFLLFVCQKSVLNQLLQKFGYRKTEETQTELSHEMSPTLQSFRNPPNNNTNMY